MFIIPSPKVKMTATIEGIEGGGWGGGGHIKHGYLVAQSFGLPEPH